SDRIRLAVTGTEELENAIRTHKEWIANEVLALDMTVGDTTGQFHAVHAVDIDGQPASVALERAV
ncbi:MAG: DUF5915 domain-containing protein, partial [Gemmatimonadaceae bacterium]